MSIDNPRGMNIPADKLEEAKKQMEAFKIKRQKKPETASFRVGINKEALDREIAELSENKRGREILELFRKLPETLDFQPGMTLVIGDNASGKTTLAKALYLVYDKEKKS